MLAEQIITNTDLTKKQALQTIVLSHSSYYYKSKPKVNMIRPLNSKLCQVITKPKRNGKLYKTWYENERVYQSLNYQTPKKVLEQTRKLAIDKV